MCENAHAALSRDAKFDSKQRDQSQCRISASTSIQTQPGCSSRYAWLWLVKEFHFYTRDFDQVVIRELSGLSTKRYAVNRRKYGTFDVGDEKTSRATRDHCDLNTRFANSRKVFCKVEGASGGCAREYLYR